TAILWDAGNGKPLRVFQGHPGAVMSVALSGDGQQIVTGAEARGVPLPALGSDAKKVVNASGTGTANLWAASGKRLHTLLPIVEGAAPQAEKGGAGGWVRSVAISADGKHIVTGAETTAILRAAVGGKKLATYEGHSGWVTSVAVSADGKHIVTGSWDKTAILWEAASGKKRHTFQGHTDVVT